MKIFGIFVKGGWQAIFICHCYSTLRRQTDNNSKKLSWHSQARGNLLLSGIFLRSWTTILENVFLAVSFLWYFWRYLFLAVFLAVFLRYFWYFYNTGTVQKRRYVVFQIQNTGTALKLAIPQCIARRPPWTFSSWDMKLLNF